MMVGKTWQQMGKTQYQEEEAGWSHCISIQEANKEQDVESRL